ncbi:MAG: hypothetical protein LBR55_00085 [Bacteroidales bacterium]|jgi:hypothetical protein|nr:hypothetical protein [Bacteroidales bacterium]
MDYIHGLDQIIKNKLLSIKNDPIKGEAFQIYKECVDYIDAGLRNGSLTIP